MEQRARGGLKFLYDYGVEPQVIPPILARSGIEFEDKVVAGIRAAAELIDCGKRNNGERIGDTDIAFVVELARDVPPGQTVFLYQPRLEAEINGWHVRGDADLLRLNRQDDGALDLLVIDMKSSTASRLEHRLQVACYHEMLATALGDSGIDATIRTAILYRGPGTGFAGLTSEQVAERQEQQRLAKDLLATDAGYLDIVADPDTFRDMVSDMITGAKSLAGEIAAAPFEAVPYHLSYKCDGCLYTEFCMKWSAEQDDLSLLPYIQDNEKKALLQRGCRSIPELARLKNIVPAARVDETKLVTAPGQEEMVHRLATTWPVGPRLDELIHRAHAYLRSKDRSVNALSIIPNSGHSSLPHSAQNHNPNLVTIYLDAQHDYLLDRVYLLGALVVGCENGDESPARRRTVIEMTGSPPEHDEQEADLIVRWARALLRAVRDVAAPDEYGMPVAPIHLIFFNSFGQKALLDALSRHAEQVFEATPLYDFITQTAAFDSSLLSFLDEEIREHKNYPMVCQSLQQVAEYTGFDWDQGEQYRQIFRERLFDGQGNLGDTEESHWYTKRARFNSQIPVEYAYAAWGELPPPGKEREFAPYIGATRDTLHGFAARRLEAIKHIARQFKGNYQTAKRPFFIPDLDQFDSRARTLAAALAEFVTIERHKELAAWKHARNAPPERRVLAGETLLVRFHEEDQAPDVLNALAENRRRALLREAYLTAANASTDGGGELTAEQRKETNPVGWPGPFRFRIDVTGVDCDLDEALLLSEIRPGERVVLARREDVDTRIPSDPRVYTPTPRQLLISQRGELDQIVVTRGADGKAVSAVAVVQLIGYRKGANLPGYVFESKRSLLPQPGELCTLDSDPNSWLAAWCADIVAAVQSGAPNTLYDRLSAPGTGAVDWPPDAARGQVRFLEGVDVLAQAGRAAGDTAAAPVFEGEVRDYIAGHGGAPLLLVQGPPGTGKSFTTAFALLARLQGAVAAGKPFRALVSCKTHSATDVLIGKVAEVQAMLRGWRARYPTLWDEYFVPELLTLALYRQEGQDTPADGVRLLLDTARPKGAPKAYRVIGGETHCIVGTTPGGVHHLLKEVKDLSKREIFHCLVLDEASQMNLPEAMLTAMALRPDGALVVVGDDRQMPPIVKHDWARERQRTFQQFQVYESLFRMLRGLEPPMIKLAESFRLHADMAAFLRQNIYEQDGIAYFSRRHSQLPKLPLSDPFLAAVLASDSPIVIVMHDDTESQQRNVFEQALIAPIVAALADPAQYGLDMDDGLGVVVPHRAQRAALQEGVPALTHRDPVTEAVVRSAVDTVERFQGGERTVILISATESDPDYLRMTGEFLLNPRRLTVALSRAKAKLVLVASQSVFRVFSTDEEVFANALLWRNLLRRTCTVPLWRGDRDAHQVEVWGNPPSE